MGSPILGSAFSPISWLGSACAQFREMFAANEKLAAIFGWMINADGEMSDAVVDGLSDRMVPCGVMLPYGGSVMPSDYWLPCNGQAISRTTYAKLFARYGTQFGEGDGSTTFNIPGARNRTLVGAGDEYLIGQTFGSKTVALGIEDTPQHYHGIGASIPTTNDAFFTGRNWSQGSNGTTWSFRILGDGVGLAGNPNPLITGGDLSTSLGIPNGEVPVETAGHENRQPSLAVNYIIKVK